jgi:hypothetical protein
MFFFFEDGTGQFLIAYLVWPVIVMTAFFVWLLIRTFSLTGLLMGLWTLVMVSILASLVWLFGNFLLLTVVVLVLHAAGMSPDAQRVGLLLFMATVMAVGAVLGWKYLLSKTNPDPSEWRL